MAEVHGFCDERFRPLEDAFRANLDCGLDKGASLAVTLGGEFVVDLWGGTRDYAMVTSWETDTVVRVFSTTKVMVVLMVLMLVDRGLLDLDEPIATYWPGFANTARARSPPVRYSSTGPDYQASGEQSRSRIWAIPSARRRSSRTPSSGTSPARSAVITPRRSAPSSVRSSAA